MRTVLCCLFLAAAGAQAGTLADANRLLAEKSYPQARHAFEQLARAGNVEAKVRYGEMLWYGEGGQPDRAAADALFAEAAATGNPDAARNLTLSSRRAAKSADIAYWVERYDGADLVSAAKACAMPQLPEPARNKDEVRAAAQQYAAWADCEKRFLGSLGGELAPERRIPGELVELMSAEEARQASQRLNAAYETVTRMAHQEAEVVADRYTAWEKSTRDYLEQHPVLAFNQDQWVREMNFDLRRAFEARIGADREYRLRDTPLPQQRR